MTDRTFSQHHAHASMSLSYTGLPYSPRCEISIRTASFDFSPSVPDFPPCLPYLFPSASGSPIPWWLSLAALQSGADCCLSKPTDCQSLNGRRVLRGRAPFRIRRRRRLGLREKIRVRKSTSKAFWLGWNRDCWCWFWQDVVSYAGAKQVRRVWFGSTMAELVFGWGIEESWRGLRDWEVWSVLKRWLEAEDGGIYKSSITKERLWQGGALIEEMEELLWRTKTTMNGFWKFIYMHCLSRYSMPFHLFIYGVVLPRWYQGCHWLQLNWTMQRNKKEAETDDQKRFIISTSLSVWINVCVCVPVASIVLWIDLWKLVCSPFGQIVKPSGYHRGTEPVWIQARIGGSTTLWSYFPKASRCTSFCNGFLETCVGGVEDSTYRLHMFMNMIYKHTHTWGGDLVLPCRTNMFGSDVVYYWLTHGQGNAYLNQSLTDLKIESVRQGETSRSTRNDLGVTKISPKKKNCQVVFKMRHHLQPLMIAQWSFPFSFFYSMLNALYDYHFHRPAERSRRKSSAGETDEQQPEQKHATKNISIPSLGLYRPDCRKSPISESSAPSRQICTAVVLQRCGLRFMKCNMRKASH